VVDQQSNAQRLAAVEKLVDLLDTECKQVRDHTLRYEKILGDMGRKIEAIAERGVALDQTLAEHLRVDNQWWRKTIAAIIEDIDGLRRLTDDTSALNGPTLPGG